MVLEQLLKKVFIYAKIIGPPKIGGLWLPGDKSNVKTLLAGRN